MIVVFEYVLLGQSEVDHVYFAGLLPMPHHEVVRFDISVDKASAMDELNAFQHLVAHHECGFEIELLTGLVEDVFQGLATQIHHHHVVLPLTTHVVNTRETQIHASVFCLQRTQDLAFVEQLRALGCRLLQLDCVLRVVLSVESEEDFSEGTRSQLLR